MWDNKNVLWLSQWDFMMGQTVKLNINMGYENLVAVAVMYFICGKR